MDLEHIELIDSLDDNKNIGGINNKSLCIKILISLFISFVLLCTWIMCALLIINGCNVIIGRCNLPDTKFEVATLINYTTINDTTILTYNHGSHENNCTIKSNILNHKIIVSTTDDSSNKCLPRSYGMLIFGYILIITSSIIIILEIIAIVYTILCRKK
jgi:hypothetical protein